MSTQKKIQVAAVQMVSTPHPAENMQAAASAIREAAGRGASLVLLPEYWAILGQQDTDKLVHAEPLGDGPLQDFMASMARECAVWLVGGTIPLASGEQGKVRNTLLAYNPNGQLAAHYDKIHLFGFSRDQETYDESRTILAGDNVAVLQADQLKVGLSICYDLRFPELYRAMGTCDLMVVPAAFTYTTGRAHWEILLRARAIENQCFVLAAAQGGKHVTGRRTWGHSMLVDPWGDILIQKSEDAGVVMGELDLAQSASVRASFPALSHRRL